MSNLVKCVCGVPHVREYTGPCLVCGKPAIYRTGDTQPAANVATEQESLDAQFNKIFGGAKP